MHLHKNLHEMCAEILTAHTTQDIPTTRIKWADKHLAAHTTQDIPTTRIKRVGKFLTAHTTQDIPTTRIKWAGKLKVFDQFWNSKGRYALSVALMWCRRLNIWSRCRMRGYLKVHLITWFTNTCFPDISNQAKNFLSWDSIRALIARAWLACCLRGSAEETDCVWDRPGHGKMHPMGNFESVQERGWRSS